MVDIYHNIVLLSILLILRRHEMSYYTFHDISYKSYLLGALLDILLDIYLVLMSDSLLTTGLIM